MTNEKNAAGGSEILAFRLYAPLASCGNEEAGDTYRPTNRHVSRSMALGIVSAALGIRRDDEMALARLRDGLMVATASHGARRVVRDFRTTQTVVESKRLKADYKSRREAMLNGAVVTSTSEREHLEDGLWRIFLASRPGQEPIALSDLATALNCPAFEIYVGRREFPVAMPLDARIVSGGLEAALAAYPAVPKERNGVLGVFHSALARTIDADGPCDIAWDWSDNAALSFPGAPEPARVADVQDEPLSRTRWRFIRRREAQARWTPPTPEDASKAASQDLLEDFWD